ncbi:MAG: acyl-CoA dehydrogenase [Alphaproteobacteria bacterium]|nr:acyl-CoA dehydrogenase [Alphaproteobacteria bacterium]
MPLDSDTLEQLVDTVGRFVRERCIPLEEQVAEQDKVPDDLIEEMKGLGLFGLTVPEEYGGLGLNTEEESRVVIELGHAAPAFRSVCGTNIGIGSQGLINAGTEEQKRKYLPGVASGEIITSFGLTEPEAGSDAAGLKTQARRDGNHWILNGTKRYITNANVAHLLTVMARTNPAKGGSGISAFLIERGTPGLRFGKPEKKMGQQGAHICDVIFEDCKVPAVQMLGGEAGEGQGFRSAMKTLDRGRIHVAALCVGMAERIVEESLKYAAERKQFGQPIANFQLIQAMLADSQTEAYAMKTMVMDAARRRDAGEDTAMLASCAKLFCSEALGRIADRGVQIHGGAGYIRSYAVERFYRDVRIVRLYEGTSQIQQIIIAREMMRGQKA